MGVSHLTPSIFQTISLFMMLTTKINEFGDMSFILGEEQLLYVVKKMDLIATSWKDPQEKEMLAVLKTKIFSKMN